MEVRYCIEGTQEHTDHSFNQSTGICQSPIVFSVIANFDTFELSFHMIPVEYSLNACPSTPFNANYELAPQRTQGRLMQYSPSPARLCGPKPSLCASHHVKIGSLQQPRNPRTLHSSLRVHLVIFHSTSW